MLAGDFDARRLAFDHNAVDAIAPGSGLTSANYRTNVDVKKIASACSPPIRPAGCVV